MTPLAAVVEAVGASLQLAATSQLDDDARDMTIEEQVESMLRAAEVPKRFLASTFATFASRPGARRALASAQRLAATPRGGPNLILLGPPGSGKTTITVGLLAQTARRHLERFPREDWEVDEGRGEAVARRPRLDMRFVVVPQFLEHLRARIGRDAPAGRSRSDPVADLMDADILVLDDLGRERETDWALERLFVIVDARYGACLPTHVTTNYSLNELADRGYGAMVSRLVEGAEVVRVTASDYRMRAAG